MKTSAVLRLAKEQVAEGVRSVGYKRRYICVALDSLRGDVPFKDIDKAKAYVMRQLQGCISLEQWLYVKHGIDTHAAFDKVQQTRHRWLAYMVKQLRKKGR